MSTVGKKVGALTAAAVVSGLGVTSASANLIGYDGIDYTPGAPYSITDGVNGGNGLPFDNTGGTPVGENGNGFRSAGEWGGTVVSGGLAYDNLETTGNSFQAASSFGPGVSTYRNFGTDPYASLRRTPGNQFTGFGADGSSMWVSFLMEADTVGDGARSSLRFGQAFGTQIAVGINPFGFSDGNTNSVRIGVEPGTAGVSSGDVFSSVVAQADTTYLLVTRIDFNAGANDDISLWINPDLTQPLGTADVAYTTANNLVELGAFQTRVDGGNVLFDEIRYGTTFESVTPVPEPGSLALAAIGGMLVLARRRQC